MGNLKVDWTMNDESGWLPLNVTCEVDFDYFPPVESCMPSRCEPERIENIMFMVSIEDERGHLVEISGNHMNFSQRVSALYHSGGDFTEHVNNLIRKGDAE